MSSFEATIETANQSYNPRLPDLVIHNSYWRTLLDYNILQPHFNVLSLSDLTIDVTFKPILVSDYNIQLLHKCKLHSFYNSALQIGSGQKQEVTSYHIPNDTIDLYRIAERNPRYCIWPTQLPLTVCTTYTDRCESYELYAAAQRAIQWAMTVGSSSDCDAVAFKSVIVFDLDETLINRDGKKFENSDKVLYLARQLYDIVVLYSHGSNLHVDEHVLPFVDTYRKFLGPDLESERPLFDLVLSHGAKNTRVQKNLLHLYNYFPQTRFTTATLVDDSLYNWTPEYTSFIVPLVESNINLIGSCLQSNATSLIN